MVLCYGLTVSIINTVEHKKEAHGPPLLFKIYTKNLDHCLKITPEALDSLQIFDNIILLDFDLK